MLNAANGRDEKQLLDSLARDAAAANTSAYRPIRVLKLVRSQLVCNLLRVLSSFTLICRAIRESRLGRLQLR